MDNYLHIVSISQISYRREVNGTDTDQYTKETMLKN